MTRPTDFGLIASAASALRPIAFVAILASATAIAAPTSHAQYYPRGYYGGYPGSYYSYYAPGYGPGYRSAPAYRPQSFRPQSYRGYDDGSSSRARRSRSTTGRLTADEKAGQAVVIREPVGGPLLAVVSIDGQRLTVYDRTGSIASTPMSSGMTGFETPLGVFSTIEKKEEHYSNLYDDAPMPFMQRITWSGVAFHAGRLPGYPASHGCIRLPSKVAQRLFELMPMGTRVVVANADPKPVAITHPMLFQPRPVRDPQLLALLNTSSDTGDKQTDATPVRAGIGMASAAMAAGAMSLAASIQAEGAPRLLDALRSQAQRELAARTDAFEQARSRLQAMRQQHRSAIAELERAEREKSAGERRLAAASEARFGARSEAAAIKAEEAEVRAEEQTTLAGKAIAEADAPALAARREIETAEAEASTAESARDEARRTLRDVERRMRPISVFVSRKAGRLYVRQGNEPVFDVEVTIKDSQRPLGTHVFTAMAVASHPVPKADWQVVTAVEPGQGASGLDLSRVTYKGARGRQVARTATEQAANVAAPVSAAHAALDRIVIADETVQRIYEVLRPGATLIVSDEGISKETGKGTDFVILTE